MITFGSLFTGIGGLDLGLERAGMQCRWQIERDSFCQRILRLRWPGTPLYDDITEIAGTELAPVDLIAGGFPCQDVSLAGLRRGIGEGTRSGLYSEMLRIVRLLRPKFILMENVSGLLIPNEPGGAAPIARVLGDLAESGFDAEWDCLPAAAFGAPHIRDRIFIVAYPNSHYGINSDEIKSSNRDRAPEIGKVLHQGEEKRDSGKRIFSGYIDASVWWDCEPAMDRVADGVPDQMDRLRVLGNAVVPQVAEWIGRRIIAVAQQDRVGQESNHHLTTIEAKQK